MKRRVFLLSAFVGLMMIASPLLAQEDKDKAAEEAKQKAIAEIKNDPPEAVFALQGKADVATQKADVASQKADAAWMLVSTALVMLMVPGLALFYCGMVRRKNVLATMMHSMVALSVVGVLWFAFGYSLAFGDPWLKIGGASILGFSKELIFMQGVKPTDLMPGGTIPVYLHMLFQGMFAIITPALISGALAERIRFKPYCIFLVLWVTIVYCPLANCVWAFNWNWTYTYSTPEAQKKFVDDGVAKLTSAEAKEKFTKFYGSDTGLKAIGYLGAMDAIDFAGGTVVHIAAGFSSLACILVLRRRRGYPEHAIHPNSMVLTLTGAGLLWFGWFGFNGGSALASGTLATSAFAATQLGAAAAGLSWMLVEWLHRGKPTALGLASGIVAGLVAVTPASGFVYPWGGLVIGLIAGVVCYISVNLKPVFKYDDSLDAFGVHGVGGFLGAVLTGFLCSKTVNTAGFNSFFVGGGDPYEGPNAGQVWIQFVAACVSAVVAFGFSIVIVKVVDILCGGFVADDKDEITGLDQTEHGETGFDFGFAPESLSTAEPRAAKMPPGADKRFTVIVDGVTNGELMTAWSELCQPKGGGNNDFKAVYPFMTTVEGNKFTFRGGDPNKVKAHLESLFKGQLKAPVKVRVE